ncbi:hypothetical protein [Streptomyces sp. NPDC085540]|uniref:hypothetical protein n=1 Tax=Streptomyces sp. NPDC085540 TaxID=3365730 RepID=UPI0037D0296C
MTQSVDAAVAQARADVLAPFRDTPVTDASGLAAVCRSARDRLTAMPVPDDLRSDPGERVGRHRQCPGLLELGGLGQERVQADVAGAGLDL